MMAEPQENMKSVPRMAKCCHVSSAWYILRPETQSGRSEISSGRRHDHNERYLFGVSTACWWAHFHVNLGPFELALQGSRSRVSRVSTSYDMLGVITYLRFLGWNSSRIPSSRLLFPWICPGICPCWIPTSLAWSRPASNSMLFYLFFGWLFSCIMRMVIIDYCTHSWYS